MNESLNASVEVCIRVGMQLLTYFIGGKGSLVMMVTNGKTSVTELDLLSKSTRQLDELFRSASARPIPDGDGRGTVLAFPGTPVSRLIATISYPLLWQGKVVDRARGELLNKLTPFRIRAVRGLVSVAPSWLDGNDCVAIDYSRTSLVARLVRDEIRLVSPGVYLGVVWVSRYRLRGLGFVLRFTSA
jgi:hypothetical protein